MDQLKKLLASLSLRQRLIIVAAVLLAAGGIWALTSLRREGDFRPLYKSMTPEDAGAVVQKLKESGVPYRLLENAATVLVPAAKVAEARLELAALGLPKSGRIGFELFDKTNLGATEFVEHINYQRALEGELERSVMALAAVEQARVHVTFPKDSVFLDSAQPGKASVMLRLHAGERLLPQNIVAIERLVASAVEGLTPEGVSVLDMHGNLLSNPRKTNPDGAQPPEEFLEMQRHIERDLVAKVNNTLEPLLGPDRFRAAVSVECDWNRGEQSEETYDPAREAILTSQKSEDTGVAGGASGIPGTASNLPRPTSRPASTTTNLSRRSENITYQPSRMIKKTMLAQGNIKRLSVSVLVDQEARWEGQGRSARRVMIPPSPETLKAIRDVVAGATGLNATRGDQVIVESLPFETTVRPNRPEGPPPPPAPWWKQNPRLMILAGLGLAMILALVGGALFLMLRNRPQPKADVEAAPQLEAAEPLDTRQLEGAEPEGQATETLEEAAPTLELPEVKVTRADLLKQQLLEVIKKEPEMAAKTLRSWLEE